MRRTAAAVRRWGLAALAWLGLVVTTGAGQGALGVSLVEEPDAHPGWVVQSGTIRVTLLRRGGHIAEVRLLGQRPALSINPLFVPTGAGYSGHLVCFPYYGPASADEWAQGLGGHGEAGSVDWHETRPAVVTAKAVTFFYGADLPTTQYAIERAVTLRAGEPSVRVEEWVENRVAYDRPYNWNQHATFGAPFVSADANVLDVSGVSAVTDARRTGGGQWSSAAAFTWPNAPRADGGPVSLRPFRARPDGQVYTPVLTAAGHALGWFTLYNLDQRLLVGYLFPASDHPWIVDWQNRPDAGGSARTARGIQFGTSPFDEGLRKSVERGRLLNTPSYRWIGARQRLSTTFQIFLTEVPPTFAGVEDVRATDERITVHERGTGRTLTVPAGWTR